MTRKVSALCVFVFLALLVVPMVGCSGSGGGQLGAAAGFAPNAGDCSTDLYLTSANMIDPRTSVVFQGITGTGTEGVSETVGISPTGKTNQALVHAPCDLPKGSFNVIMLPPTGGTANVGTFQRL